MTALASWNGIVAGCNGKVNGNFDSTGNGSRTLKPDVHFTFQISKCCFRIQDHQKIFFEMELRQIINDDKRKCVSLSLSNDDDDWAFQELVWLGIEGQGMLISDIGSRPRKKWRSGTELWCRRRTPDWPRNSYSHAAMDKQKYIWIENKCKAYCHIYCLLCFYFPWSLEIPNNVQPTSVVVTSWYIVHSLSFTGLPFFFQRYIQGI